MPKRRNDKKTWRKKCWTLMSQLVRRKDADFAGYATCFTCQKKKPWKEMDAGHFMHGKLDFDERNVRPQCVQCNKWMHGNLNVYAMRLVRMYGSEWVDNLMLDAHLEKPLSVLELKEIHAELLKKLESL